MKRECATLKGCETGQAKITNAYNLPCKRVIHTVGPIGEHPQDLAKSYTNSLDLMLADGLKSIAFPCISTGVYGYPQQQAAQVALESIRKWLDSHEPQSVS